MLFFPCANFFSRQLRLRLLERLGGPEAIEAQRKESGGGERRGPKSVVEGAVKALRSFPFWKVWRHSEESDPMGSSPLNEAPRRQCDVNVWMLSSTTLVGLSKDFLVLCMSDQEGSGMKWHELIVLLTLWWFFSLSMESFGFWSWAQALNSLLESVPMNLSLCNQRFEGLLENQNFVSRRFLCGDLCSYSAVDAASGEHSSGTERALQSEFFTELWPGLSSNQTLSRLFNNVKWNSFS